jgi:hypothetical protein
MAAERLRHLSSIALDSTIRKIDRVPFGNFTGQDHGGRIYWHQPGPSWFEDPIAYCNQPSRHSACTCISSHTMSPALVFVVTGSWVVPRDDGVTLASFQNANGHTRRHGQVFRTIDPLTVSCRRGRCQADRLTICVSGRLICRGKPADLQKNRRPWVRAACR